MTDASTLELVELDTALDFEHTPECQGYNCPEDADWLATQRCCGANFYLCGHCHQIDLEVTRFEWACATCYAKNPKTAWTPVK